ncbi:MAG: outer membrane beta-barrel protein [Saprospiraceae bacterium]|nr:outer membrane beta-barrel protein [Saprospiraceae bacterium]
MEGNLHDDNLEKLLQKYLQDNSVEPDNESSVWANIESRLDAGFSSSTNDNPSPKGILKYLSAVRWYAAAACIIGGFGVLQYVYFNNKINHLQKQVSQQQKEASIENKNSEKLDEKSLEYDNNKKPSSINRSENDPKVINEEKHEGKSEPIVPSVDTKLPPKVIKSNSNSRISTHSASNSSYATNSEEIQYQALTPTNTNNRNDVVTTNNNSQNFIFSNDEPILVNNAEVLPGGATNVQKIVDTPSSEISHIPTTVKNIVINDDLYSSEALHKLRLSNELASSSIPIQKVASPSSASRQSLAVNGGKFKTFRSVKNFNDDDRPLPPEVKRFDVDEKLVSEVTSLSLVFRQPIKDRFSVFGGVAYQEVKTNIRHRSDFKFREARPHHGGGMHGEEDFDFNYELNTSLGSADLRVSLEAIDTSLIDDNDDIVIDMTASHETRQIALPLGVEYILWKKGRFSSFLQAGLTPKFTIYQNFSVNKVEVDNEYFLPIRELNSETAETKFNDNRKFSLDCSLGLGLAFNVNKHLSLLAIPSYGLALRNESENPHVVSKVQSLGGTFGVQYLF